MNQSAAAFLSYPFDAIQYIGLSHESAPLSACHRKRPTKISSTVYKRELGQPRPLFHGNIVEKMLHGSSLPFRESALCG